jgi:hypothetical protein
MALLQQIPAADGVEDELGRQSASDLARPRFKVHGSLVDQVIDAGGPAFEIQIWGWLKHHQRVNSSSEQSIARAQMRQSTVTAFRQRGSPAKKAYQKTQPQ